MQKITLSLPFSIEVPVGCSNVEWVIPTVGEKWLNYKGEVITVVINEAVTQPIVPQVVFASPSRQEELKKGIEASRQKDLIELIDTLEIENTLLQESNIELAAENLELMKYRDGCGSIFKKAVEVSERSGMKSPMDTLQEEQDTERRRQVAVEESERSGSAGKFSAKDFLEEAKASPDTPALPTYAQAKRAVELQREGEENLWQRSLTQAKGEFPNE